MFSHGDKIDCYKGKVEQLSGPAMTYKMKVIYPCNRSACNHGCDCGFCDLSSLCPPETHKQHIRNSDKECIVQKSICQDILLQQKNILCGKTFTRIDTLQQHISIIHLKEDASFPCQFCGQEFTRKRNLTRHERRVHGDK